MRRIKIFLLIFLSINFIGIFFYGQTVDRLPYAAGKFYEADSALLVTHMHSLFKSSDQTPLKNVRALIVPHAGYEYSGKIAAAAYKTIEPGSEFTNIFIIGSSHRIYMNGASVYTKGDYITPLGKVKVNHEIANNLIDENPFISYVPEAHEQEHIIENQLPFIQYYLKPGYRIVPISVGTDDPDILSSMAATLEPYLGNEKNLFIISADFSHYPRYEDAKECDSLTAKSILSNNVNTFEKALSENEKKGYPGLVTSTCGSTSIKLLLNITADNPDLRFLAVANANSGDVAIGNKSRVVGYYAIAVTQHPFSSFHLTDDDKSKLLTIARLTIDEYVNKREKPNLEDSQFSKDLLKPAGAFVTLKKEGQLRGCIGHFGADKPLYQTVQDMAIAASTQDYRFTPVHPEEINLIDLEISVLTPMQKINSIEEIKLGRDGIYIVKGNRSGTFLPQVAAETGWSLEEFLGHCARDKAGIGWDGWKDADIYIYQAIVFGENVTR